MPEITISEWNEFLIDHPDAHLLQAGEWGKLKSSFGWDAVHILEEGLGAQLLFRRLPVGFTFAYIPKGPVGAAGEKAGRQFWKAVDAVCKKKRAVFLKLEQDGWKDTLKNPPAPPGFVVSPQHIQPQTTLVVDLRGREEDVFNRMKPKTRYNIRLASRKGVVVKPSDDIVSFYKVMNITSQRETFHVHSLDYYRRAYDLFHPRGMCELLAAEFEGQTLAVVMVFALGKTGYYFYGASEDVERQRKPTYPIQWEAIRWTRERGCLEYDMWGIPDEATDSEDDEAEIRDDGLWGVYRFKRGFGGSIRRARPALDRVYNPILYKFYHWRYSTSNAD